MSPLSSSSGEDAATNDDDDNNTSAAATTAGEQQGGSGGGGAPPAGCPPFPLVDSFTAIFEEPGTYPYFYGIHPWMTCEVVVRGGNDDSTTRTSTP